MRKIIYLFLALFVGVIVIHSLDNYNGIVLDDVSLKEKENSTSNMFAIMVENEDGEYVEYTGSGFPTGMSLNEEYSGCIDSNGNTINNVLTYNSSTNQVSVTANGAFYCYLYFDIYEINCVDEGITSLSECILRSENNFQTEDEAIEYIKDEKGTPDFSVIATDDEGLYYATDDYGDSYYFRGAVTDNYVYFAGFYWRIIRINGDGSIRMIYDGSMQAYDNGDSTNYADRYISKSSFNTASSDNAYVGYMYGTAGSSTYEETHENKTSSTIKEVVDEWYYANIYSKTDGTNSYDDYISDTLFCNDRSVYSGTGVGTTLTTYGSRSRLESNSPGPVLTCSIKTNDAFTVNDEVNGNGALTHKVALITADEVAMAGGMMGNADTSERHNTLFYLYIGEWYWTMSPSYTNYYAYVYGMSSTGYLSAGQESTVANSRGVRPVINLSSSVILTGGNGTIDSPYLLSMN